MFKFNWKTEKVKKEESKKEYIEESELNKTRQNSGVSFEAGRGLKKSDGVNLYGENSYNLSGHEDDERLRDKQNTFVPIEDVVDKDAEEAIYEQAGSERKLEDAYDHETEFMSKAIKVLEAKEFKQLFSFLKKLDDSDVRKEYFSTQDESGESFPPVKRVPADILDLIKKVNISELSKNSKLIKKQRGVIRSSEFEHNDNGEMIGAADEKTPEDQVRFKVKEIKRKIVKNRRESNKAA